MEDTDSKINGAVIDAAIWNQVPKELVNLITSTGQTLSAADLFQVRKAIAIYVANGNFYSDGGAADAYILSTIGGKQSITAYLDGVEINFVALFSNTSASTVNVVSIGVVDLRDSSGVALSGGEIQAGNLIKAVYNFAAGHFRLVLSNASLTNQGFTSYNNGTASISETEAATPLAVSTAKAEAISEVQFPEGTILLFSHTLSLATAPPGWTKILSNGQHAIRITTASPGITAGSVNFTTVFSNSRATSTVGPNVGNTSLTVAQIPAHTHNIDLATASVVGNNVAGTSISTSTVGTTNSAGSGQSHTHSLPAHSHTSNLAVKYVTYIEASKDP